MNRSRLLAPVAVGAAGLTIGAAYVYGGFLPYRDYAVLPLVVLGFPAAFAAGVRRSDDVRPLARLRSGAAWGALFAAAVPVPYLVRWAKLDIESHGVPVPQGTTFVSRYVDPIRFDGRPDWQVEFSALTGSDKIDAFYRARLVERGWTPVERLHLRGCTISAPGYGVVYRRGDRWIELLVTPNTRRCDTILLRPDPRPERFPW